MNKSKCRHCGYKLGDFLYADACPSCHQELEHNITRSLFAPAKKSQKEEIWPFRVFQAMVRFVES